MRILAVAILRDGGESYIMPDGGANDAAHAIGRRVSGYPAVKRGERVERSQEKGQQIERLYRETYTTLYRYAMNALGNPSLAEEAVQEAFRIACAKPENLLISENPKGWLMNALKLVLQNNRRSAARLSSMMASLYTTSVVTTTPQDGVELCVMCEQALGEADYRLLRMVAFGQYSMLEAAKELGIPLEVCRKRFYRAKQKLKKLLEDPKK